MKLNAFADVCLRTLMLLGSRGETRLTTREIAEQIDIPYHHVSKAVLDLRNAGALEVTRGRLGGSLITESGLDLSVGALLRRLDEHQDLADCIAADGRACPLLAGCRLRSALSRAREAFYAELDPVTVRDLASGPALVGLPFPLFN